jgi:hypothetical protein
MYLGEVGLRAAVLKRVAVLMVLGLCAILQSVSVAQRSAGSGVDYTGLADIVVNRAWKLAPGEHVVVFADPALDRGAAEPLRKAIRRAGGVVEEITAPTSASVNAMTAADRAARYEEWKAIFARASAAIWLPSDPTAVEDRPFERLVESSKVRSIHFHWFIPPDSGDVPVVEKMYEAAIHVPPALIAERIAKVEFALVGKKVRVTAPNGTDLTFVIPANAWVHRNTGDASAAKVANARSVRDREEELPASVFRTTDISSATGVLVGYASFDTRSPVLKATFANGKVTQLESVRGADEIVRSWKAASGAKDLPGEFVVGTNPELEAVLPSGFMPYYGYGAGVVRLAIGDNWESGGTNRSSNGEVLMFVLGATVEAGNVAIIANGEYTAGGP